MDIDWSAYPYGAHYAAYLDHLMRCTECGPTRCAVGADLCTRYLATAAPRRAALPGPGPVASVEEPR